MEAHKIDPRATRHPHRPLDLREVLPRQLVLSEPEQVFPGARNLELQEPVVAH